MYAASQQCCQCGHLCAGRETAKSVAVATWARQERVCPVRGDRCAVVDAMQMRYCACWAAGVGPGAPSAFGESDSRPLADRSGSVSVARLASGGRPLRPPAVVQKFKGKSEVEVVVDDQRRVVAEALLEVDRLPACQRRNPSGGQVVAGAPPARVREAVASGAGPAGPGLGGGGRIPAGASDGHRRLAHAQKTSAFDCGNQTLPHSVTARF